MARITTLSNGFLTTKVFVGYNDIGSPVQKRVTAKTKAELDKLITKAKRDYQKEYNKKKVSPTLQRAYEKYIEERESLLSPATIRTYTGYLKYSFSSLMKKNIDDVTKEDIQREINKMIKTDSPKTIRNKFFLLNAVLKEYAKNGSVNNIKLPKKKKVSLYIPTKEDIEVLLEKIKDTPLEIPIMFACFCGMRRGEIFALSYDDIDFKRQTVSVNKAIGLDEIGGYDIKEPKSYAGYRDIDIPNRLMDAIRQQRKRKLPLIELTIAEFAYRYPRLFDELPLHRFRFHDIRHYYASILITLGVPDIYAIKLLGHATINFLRQNYQHIMQNQYDLIRQRIRENLN